jgi:hypothetical protein
VLVDEVRDLDERRLANLSLVVHRVPVAWQAAVTRIGVVFPSARPDQDRYAPGVLGVVTFQREHRVGHEVPVRREIRAHEEDDDARGFDLLDAPRREILTELGGRQMADFQPVEVPLEGFPDPLVLRRRTEMDRATRSPYSQIRPHDALSAPRGIERRLKKGLRQAPRLHDVFKPSPRPTGTVGRLHHPPNRRRSTVCRCRNTARWHAPTPPPAPRGGPKSP